MTLDALIMLVGAIVAAAPFLGLPVGWYGPIFFILGVIVIGLGIIARRRGMGSTPISRGNEFVESIPRSAIPAETLEPKE